MKKEIDNKEIVNLFNNGKSCVEIAKFFNCNPETIRLRLKKENINTSKVLCNIKCIHCNSNSRKEGKNKYGKQRYLCLNTKCGKLFVSDKKEMEKLMFEKHDKIKKMYLDDNLSTTEIASKLGVSSTVPQRILKKYNITRNISYAKELKNANNLGITYDEYLKRLPAFKKYRKKVIYYTNKQDLNSLPNYEKRGKSGVDGAYQLDHKYSILEGFKNGIEPDVIANINNLIFIPWKDNLNKSSLCSITVEELLINYNPTKDILVRVK
jgi:transposase-like protein